jgi:hypothetical protein
MLFGERTSARPIQALSLAMLVIVASTLSFATDAHAKKRRRQAPTGPLKVVVIPFEAEGPIAYEVPQQLELELELNESVTVVSSARTWAELKKQGTSKFDRKRLQKVMQRRGVDVLVRGVKGYDDDGGDALHVLLYANDGRVRFQGTISESLDAPDALVGVVASVVEEPLKRFRGLAAIEPVFPEKRAKRAPEKPSRVVRDEPTADDSALFVDIDDGKKPKKREPAAPPPRAVLDDERPAARATEAKPRAGGRRALADDDDDLLVDDDTEQKKPARRAIDDTSDDREDEKPKRRRFDDTDGDVESEDEPRRSKPAARTRFIDEAPEDVDDDGGRMARERRSRASMADVVDDDKGDAEPTKLSHLFSLSLGGGAATWVYSFAANKPGQEFTLPPSVFPAATLRADLWPIEWVGVDVDAHIQGVSFNIEDPTNTVRPTEFISWRYGASAAAKGRYILHLGNFGVGAGGRVGYRLLGVYTENQTHTVDGDFFTLVPGYMFHTIFFGAELYGAVVFLDRRLELEFKIDGLPLTRYEEYPDNPGAQSVAVGWATTSTARMEIFYGTFAELYLFHSGGIAFFDGVGTRRSGVIDSTTGKRELIEGGRVTTIDATMGLSVGWMW